MTGTYRMRIRPATLCIMLLIPALAGAVQISLDPVMGRNADSSTGSIGYVDIERIFREHPQTERSKSEFDAEVAKRRAGIAEQQQALEAMRQITLSSATIVQQKKADIDALRANRPVLLENTTAAYSREVSSGAVLDAVMMKAKEIEIASMEEDLAKMRQDAVALQEKIAARIAQDKDELASWEDTRTSEVLGDIYEIIQAIATEEHLTVIFDKSNILYGQKARDLTDMVRERMKGR